MRSSYQDSPADWRLAEIARRARIVLFAIRVRTCDREVAVACPGRRPAFRNRSGNGIKDIDVWISMQRCRVGISSGEPKSPYDCRRPGQVRQLNAMESYNSQVEESFSQVLQRGTEQ